MPQMTKKIETVTRRNEMKKSRILKSTGTNRAIARPEAISWSIRMLRIRFSAAFSSRIISSLSDIRRAVLSVEKL